MNSVPMFARAQTFRMSEIMAQSVLYDGCEHARYDSMDRGDYSFCNTSVYFK